MARVRFLRTDEGGRAVPPTPGVRAQIELGEFQTSCVVGEGYEGSEMPLGVPIDVQIRVVFPEHVSEAFAAIEAVELYDGSRLVATGGFLDA